MFVKFVMFQYENLGIMVGFINPLLTVTRSEIAYVRAIRVVGKCGVL